MELKELKLLWEQHYNLAEDDLTLNKQLLTVTSLSKVKSNLWEFRATAVIELVCNGLFAIYLLSFMVTHWAEWAFFFPGTILWLMVAAGFVWNIYSLHLMHSMNLGMSIIKIQKKIQDLAVYRRYQLKSLYIAIPLFALCFTVVLPKALFDFSIYPYLGFQWYFHLLGTIAITPLVVWFVGLLPDRGMEKAQQFLKDIAYFEKTKNHDQ